MKTADISVELLNHCGDDLTIVNAARVSFDKESQWEYEMACGGCGDSSGKPCIGCTHDFGKQQLSKGDRGLLSYLARNGHHSPFNHAFLSFRIKAPVFSARQLVKHKFMPWNEISRRYVKSEPEFYLPEYWRKAAENVKQGSSEEAVELISCLRYDDEKRHDPMKATRAMCEDALNLYMSMIASGICPEQARMVLPLNTMTEWIWSGTLGAFLDMLKLRLPSDSQYESRVVAQKAYTVVKQLFPVSTEVYLND